MRDRVDHRLEHGGFAVLGNVFPFRSLAGGNAHTTTAHCWNDWPVTSTVEFAVGGTGTVVVVNSVCG